MAESIVYNTAEKILGQLASFVGTEISLAWGLESDLKWLETAVSSIKAVLSDAEEREPGNEKIKIWLTQLRDALLDAEDVVDEFAYQALRSKLTPRSGRGITNKVRRFFCSSKSNQIPYRLQIGHKINKIRIRLTQINSNKDEFGLNERSENTPFSLSKREITNSLINASDVLGRDGDRAELVEFLMDSGSDSDHNVSVVPIFGIGGIGKTVLAKLVFNDRIVVKHFDARMWVCLGDRKEFDANDTLSKISNFFTGQASLVENTIKEHVEGKRFLFVLDDIWDVDRNKWLDFKGLLAGGAKGSKILVTTRSRMVTERVRDTTDPYNLKELPHEKCVSLFKKLAFAREADVDEDLMMIGEEIVRKCRGVPLAVRSLGGLLFSKSDRREWLSVRDSDIWQIDDNIISILKFSYDHLPSQMKQCFLCCSFFPEDYVFEENSLVSLWMAHRLLEFPENKQGGKGVVMHQPEYVGKQFINEFLSIGFFQDFHQVGWQCKFKMHDLVAELARWLARDEFTVVDANQETLPENVRHVWFQDHLCPAKSSDKIRSVVVVPNVKLGSGTTCFKEFISRLNNLKFLRIANSELEVLPDCIGTLTCLRSLELLECKRLKKLSNCICKLHNLLTLSLYGCEELEELPTGMEGLVNLRWLCVTTGQKYLPENGIGSLSSLRFLWFWKCPRLETLFEGTQIQLKSLRTLIVFGCHNLISFCPHKMNYSLPSLEILDLQYCRDLSLARESDGASCFLQRLTHLKITFLARLDCLPDWVQECASTLRYLEIQDCRKLRALPEWLPNLTSLRTLKIECCSGLLSLPRGMRRLTALKELEIKRCGELSGKCRKEGEEWSNIAHLPNILIQ